MNKRNVVATIVPPPSQHDGRAYAAANDGHGATATGVPPDRRQTQDAETAAPNPDSLLGLRSSVPTYSIGQCGGQLGRSCEAVADLGAQVSTSMRRHLASMRHHHRQALTTFTPRLGGLRSRDHRRTAPTVTHEDSSPSSR